MHRRAFLKLASLLPLSLAAPQALTAEAQRSTTRASKPDWNRVLVLVELNGGNDGLNTVIPYPDRRYSQLRPRLAIDRDRVLHVSGQLGLHPALEPLMSAWAGRELAIVLGLGYPSPNRSHFRSIEIWETGSDSQTVLDDGWLARVFTHQSPPSHFVTDGIVLGRGGAGPLQGRTGRNIILANPGQFLRQARRTTPVVTSITNPALAHILSVQNDVSQAAQALQLSKQSLARADFPQTRIGRQFQLTATLLTSRIPVAVIKLSHGSFDTHSNQKNKHERLLKELAQALAAFRQALQADGQWDRVLVMTYAEFGRRAAENGSGGTDHGTAAPHFLLGGQVRGGLYGQQPSLSNLRDGDLQYTLDYRSLYATVAQRWWHVSGDFLDGQRFPAVECLA